METTLVKLRRCGVVTEWMFKVSSWPELECYMDVKYKDENLTLDVISHAERMSDLFMPYNPSIANEMLRVVFPVLESPYMERNNLIDSKLRCISECGSIAINRKGGWSPICDGEVIEEVVTQDYAYPRYTESMIHISQWANGTHYYACIGDVDVVDSKGNQKWNTHKMAMEKAIEMLPELNSSKGR